MSDELELGKNELNSLRSEVDLLKQENAKLKKTIKDAKDKAMEKYAIVTQRWEDLQNKLVARTQLFQEHIEGRAKAEEASRWLFQVVGTLDCLDMLARVDGLNIPAERIELLNNDKAK